MDESDRSLSAADLTRLLKAWNRGDAAALEELTPIVYQELHRLARLQMADERPGHMLQPSALVNEAFLRLTRNAPVEWESLRQVLIDFARAQGTRKRGERVQHLDVADLRDAVLPASGGLDPVDLVDLDEALDRLASLDGRQAQVVELRFFGGMENGEIAAVLGISEPTVIRAWLYDTLQHRP
jgi:RNA polymerase sigma factor (TIGR02999 family)